MRVVVKKNKNNFLQIFYLHLLDYSLILCNTLLHHSTITVTPLDIKAYLSLNFILLAFSVLVLPSLHSVAANLK